MVVGLISVSFGFDLGRAAATFFDLRWCRWWLITLGGSEEPILMPSDGEMLSSTREGCAGVSLLAAATSSRSAFANAPCESEMPTVVSARGWTTATALRGGVLSSIAARWGRGYFRLHRSTLIVPVFAKHVFHKPNYIPCHWSLLRPTWVRTRTVRPSGSLTQTGTASQRTAR